MHISQLHFRRFPQVGLEILGVGNKNTKKIAHVREIIFRSHLWSQKRAQSIQHDKNNVLSAQEHFQSPLELRDR